ncbi:MAG: ABC transporter ATP-binding protein [Actinomycetota bacterium]
MSGPTLLASGLRQAAGSTTLLELDQLHVDGGTIAVLGPNGAGKSTMLRMLATVNPPTAGTLHLEGIDALDPTGRVAVRRRLGYVAQRDGLPSRMRVQEYLDYVGALKEIGPERLRRRWAAWALERVELTDVRRDRISTLSGGMQRRLTIAQALLGGPDYLVLDEPLTSLDAEHRSRITSLLVGLADQATVVIATHHADELAAVCRRVVVLDAGRIVFDGGPDDLAARAIGRVWDAATPDPYATCRAIGPDRHRCVGGAVPDGAEPAEPSVADGYVAVVRYGA